MGANKSKTDLVEAVARKMGISKAQAGSAVDAVFESITDMLKKGDTLTVLGFGKFSTVAKPEREGRNVRTGEPIKIKAQTAAKFSALKGLKDAINS